MGSDITPIQWRKMTFISIHAPRMGSDLPAKPASRSMSISIHAPRMGSDLPSMVGEPCPVRFQSTLPGWGATGLRRRWGRPDQISIHAPRMGSDEAGARMAAACMEFQSTLPGWGATCRQCDIRRRSSDFNPRSPDGERLICDIIKGSVSRISIHAPRMGSDASDDNRSCPMADFNPRSPDGERPRVRWAARRLQEYFNPRSPDGERPVTVPPWPIVPIFQSTLPGWGATLPLDGARRVRNISIHAPRMGSDFLRRCCWL